MEDTPYTQGRRAYIRESGLAINPYPDSSSKEWLDWERGWIDSYRDEYPVIRQI